MQNECFMEAASTSNILPSPHHLPTQEDHDNTFYSGVKQCVLHFANGKYKVISNDNTNDLFAVNVVIYSKVVELDLVELVLKHYKNSTSIDDLAIRCGYKSTKTFTRHFKQKFNTTPKQWLLQVKQNELVHYLENTDYPLKKLVSILGFSNISHLRDFCEKKTGKSPEDIREL